MITRGSDLEAQGSHSPLLVITMSTAQSQADPGSSVTLQTEPLATELKPVRALAGPCRHTGSSI